MAHLLNPEELKVITPKKEIKPRSYQLNPDQTLFFGGLARLDIETKERMSVVVYLSNELEIHRRKTEGSDEFYEKHVGELLTPPLEKRGELALKKHTFTIKEELKKTSQHLLFLLHKHLYLCAFFQFLLVNS